MEQQAQHFCEVAPPPRHAQSRSGPECATHQGQRVAERGVLLRVPKSHRRQRPARAAEVVRPQGHEGVEAEQAGRRARDGQVGPLTAPRHGRRHRPVRRVGADRPRRRRWLAGWPPARPGWWSCRIRHRRWRVQPGRRLCRGRGTASRGGRHRPNAIRRGAERHGRSRSSPRCGTDLSPLASKGSKWFGSCLCGSCESSSSNHRSGARRTALGAMCVEKGDTLIP
jgi:hypothetical protein